MNAFCSRCGKPLPASSDPAKGPCLACGHGVAASSGPLWYVPGPNNQPQPMPQSELVAALAAGKIGKDVFVWRDGLGEWKAAGTLAELKPGAADPSNTKPTTPLVPAKAPAAAAAPAKAAAPAPAAEAAPEKKGRPRDQVSWTLWSEGGINLEEAAELQRSAAGANAVASPSGAMPPMPTQPTPGKGTRILLIVLIVAAIALGVALVVGLGGKKKAPALPPAAGAPAAAPAAP